MDKLTVKVLGTPIGSSSSGGQQATDGDGDGYVASMPGGPDDTPVRKRNQAPAVRGQIEKGNIDLNNRPVVRNSDGSISTVRSISITEGKITVLIPTVIRDKKGRGKVVSDSDAIRHYQRSGEHLGKFSSSGDADRYAEQLHNQQAAQYTGKSLAVKVLGMPIGGVSEIDGDGDGFRTGPTGRDNIPVAPKASQKIAGDASKKLKEEFESPEVKIPKSPPNPKGLNARAIYNWVDGPFRRDHPKQFPINDMIRHIANGILGFPLPKYRGIRFRAKDTYIRPDVFVERTKNLIESIDGAEPKQPVLWRGLRGGWARAESANPNQQQQVMNLKVGESFVSPIFSSSRSKDVATALYASHLVERGDPPSVVLKIEAGAKGLRTSVIPDDHEVLTGGKFTVTAKTESSITLMDYSVNPPVPFEHKVVVMSVKQVDTFGKEDYTNPDFRPDESYNIRKRQ